MSNFNLLTTEDRVQSQISPSVLAFEKELENILLKFAKRDSSGDGYLVRDDVRKRKLGFSKLFKEFKPRLQHHYYVEKLMQIGNFLYSIKAFQLAKFQCFTRYLQDISSDFTFIESVAEYSFETFQEKFFPNGLDDAQAVDTIKVLYEDTMCSYELLTDWDPKLQNMDSVHQCLQLLKILMLTTQLALQQESFSWLVYNGTIHIYTISRQLMVIGRSNMVLEYMLWACMCMEGSIPLLTLKYIPWRSTLYAGVCLCYIDCKEPQHAETFARRALKKIAELADIEQISTSVSTPESKAIFQAANVKINVFIFQRVVFESRKKPKAGFLRPKIRVPLREALHPNWPRNQTERQLGDFFDGSVAQFLAILHTLGEPHRRTLQCKAPTGSIDDITLDIYPELFVAGVDLISGGSNTRVSRHDAEVHPFCIELSGASLLDLPEQGVDGVPLSFVVKFVKLAFSYEQWEVVEALLHPFMTLLKTQAQVVQTPAYVMSLQLLAAMEPLFNTTGRKQQKKAATTENTTTENSHEKTLGNKGSTSPIDELLVVANILNGFSSELPKSALPYVDVDMVIDATLFLWNRCKPYFQRVVSSNQENCRHVLNDTDCDKWLFILLTIDNVLHWSGLSDVDPIVAAEVALKLALVLEAKASSVYKATNTISVRKMPPVDEAGSCEKTEEQVEAEESLADTKPYHVVFPNTFLDLLYMAFNILESGVERVSEAREKMVKIFGEKHGNSNKTNQDPPEVQESDDKSLKCSEKNIDIEIIHLELLFNLTRVLAKLQSGRISSEITLNSEKAKTPLTSSQTQVRNSKSLDTSWTVDMLKRYNKLPLTRALLLMHTTQIQDTTSETAQQNLQECHDIIKKCQTQEKVLASRCRTPNTESIEATVVPPPPILVFRCSSRLTFKPAPFKPQCQKRVCWYRLFGCSASGSNVKVRLNDSELVGTGVEVPAGPNSRFFVTNLVEGERYVFALAAYDKNGDLIGGGIGPTSPSYPASHPMPMIMAWAYLTKAAYSCGVYDIAKTSAQVLWKYFIPDESPPSSDNQLSLPDGQLTLCIQRCDPKMLAESNQPLVRQFVQSVFISVDIAIQHGKLYCDSLCDYGTLLPGQIQRMRQCENMLLVLQISLWLNDNNIVLQTLTRCYGLIAPLLQLKIPSKPVVQVLLQCYAVIQEIPTLNRFRKNSMTYDSLYHLITVMTYYLTKVLPLWGEQELANMIKDYGRKLLTVDAPTEQTASTTAPMIISQDAISNNQPGGTRSKTKGGKGKKKKVKGGVVKVIAKPEQSNKSGCFQKNEFAALETTYTKRASEAVAGYKNDYELTGGEDPGVLTNYVAVLTANDGYKEVVKFKRRTKYLQYFVLVAEKALAGDFLEKVLEWSNETETWLNKRNDILLPFEKAFTTARQSSDPEGEDTKNRKFATAIVEYGKSLPKKTKSMKQLLETLAYVEDRDEATSSSSADGKPVDGNKPVKPVKTGKPSPPVQSTSPVRAPAHMPRINRKRKKRVRSGNENDLIRAIEALQSILPTFWKTEGKKRKLRAITAEENPWRCQWNVIRALASFRMFLKNTKKADTYTESSTSSNFDSNMHVLDTEWFGFDISGVLIRQRNSILKDSSTSFKNLVTSFTQQGDRQNPLKKKEQLRIDEETEYLRYVCNACKYLSKAVVLSYRCKYWGLLQNTCSQLWNMRQKLYEYSLDPSSQITDDVLYEITWSAFYFAADTLLDMLLYIAQTKKETSKTKCKVSKDSDKNEVSFWGDIELEKGGSDLIFEQYLDDQITADVVWIKRVVMHCMEVLFYKEKWERLADIIFRFNALSRGRYAEKVLPLLVFAQEKLLQKAQQYGGVSTTQPDVVLATDSGKPEGLHVNLDAGNASFEPAVHIDPKGHDVYSNDNNAKRLFCVPVRKSNTLQLLKESVELKHSAARALQHSRELFLRYLVGLGQHLKKSPSRVAFVPSEDPCLTATPPNINELKFDKIDDVQKCPLTSSQLAVVITSYDKTIEMLQFHGRRALLAQAMNEIGNIMLHIGNKRSAYRWWQTVLDTILAPVSQSVDGQTSHNRYHDAVYVEPSVLLKKRGIWGCLLAAVTAVNIARYIQTDNADKRLDYCCAAASLLKAMFSCSLPHPTSCCDFALYDIGNGFPVGTLIPGINLFSDPFRCDAKVLLSSTVWLAEELIDTGYYLMVLPLLTLARYISSDVFESDHWVTKVLILRIRALTKAGMYSRSCHVLNTLMLGKNMKKTPKNQTIDSFHCDRPLNDPCNIQALANLISNRLSPVTALAYGSEASRCLMLEQARLLVEIAASVYAIPRNLKTQLAEKLNGENLEASVLEASKTSSKPVIIIFDDDDDITQVTIKSYLLAGAELLLEELRFELLGQQKDLKDFLDARGHLFKPINFKTLILVELELANILHQYFESLRAAKVIYECMRALEDASVLLEHDAIRLGSAWTAFSRSPDPAKTPDSLRSDVGSVKSDIDANLWLTCRIKMVEYLFGEENGVGRIAGFSRSVVALTGSAEQHCDQGLDESDAFGHSEIVAQLQFDAFLLKLKGGCLTREDFDALKGTIDKLQNFHPLSMKGSLLLVKLLIYHGDIAGSFGGTPEESCESYRKAETIVNKQILALGHDFENSSSESSQSKKNIYLCQNILLAETKLRLGRDKLQDIDSSSETKNIQDVLSFLMEALGIVTDAKMDQNPLESEFLFLIGVCQNYLWIKEECSPTVVIMSFVDAIKKTYSFDHNLDLMRKCYEQLALFYLAKTQRIKKELEDQRATRNSPKLSRAVTKLARKDAEGKIKDKHDILIKRGTKKELRATWIAARAMAALTAIIDTRGQLHGDVSGLLIPRATGEKIPLPVIYDLLGSVSIKSDDDHGHYMQGDGIITMDSWINGLNTVQLTWNHLLSYIEYLQRQVSYQSLGIKMHGGPLFRWPKLLKLHQMHEFLGSELEVYVAKSFGVKSSPLLLLPDLPLKPNEKDAQLRGKSVDEAGENEISISWVSANPVSKRFKAKNDDVECVYAFNNKAISGVPITGVNAGRKTVLRKTLVDVHEQLQSLLEMAENEQILVQAKVTSPDAPPVPSGTPQTARKKKVSSVRNLSSSAVRRVSEALSNLRECVNAINQMMQLPPMSEKKDVPFEPSHSNMRILESVFNPSRGYIGKIPDSMHQWMSSMFV